MASALNHRNLTPSPQLLLILLLAAVPNCAVSDQFSAELFSEADPRRCRDSFDGALKKQCMRGEWEQKYYFDAESRECRLFWYDGCPGLTGSRNFFDSLLECQWLCEPGDRQTNSICLEPFDEHLRDECESSGNWRRHFYFDRFQRRCVPFWFDGCASPCGNHFGDEISCMEKCGVEASNEEARIHYKTLGPNYVPAWRLISTTLRTPTSWAKEGTGDAKTERMIKGQKMPKVRPEATRTITTKGREADSFSRLPSARFPFGTPSVPSPSRNSALSPSSSTRSPSSVPSRSSSSSFFPKNGCGRESPCQNGGICVHDMPTERSICKCVPPFTNDFCTERIDFDPCSPNPCQNGATCSAIAGPMRTEFDCFCARGFAGIHCEFKPCEDNPCKNGGTCRTTRAKSMFFCACPPGWAGKTCMMGGISSSGQILANKGEEKANLTRQLSSGKAEWIEELRRVTPMVPNSEERTDRNSFGKLRLSSPPSDGKHRPITASAVSVVGFPHDQIVGQELPTRTLKGTTSTEETNGAEMGKKWADRRALDISVPGRTLAICYLLVISFLVVL